MKRVFLIFVVFLLSLSANLLEKEDSPYLQQHKNNPVNWRAWSKESLELAKKLNKPIFLSIGYSTCHWCHVMEEESFENPKIAKLINRYFIAIKVDKEQMPHLDKKYQELYQKLYQKGGGWPLNVFLTPNLEPFFITTYIPPHRKFGMQGLDELIVSLGLAFKSGEYKKNVDAIEAIVKKYKVKKPLKKFSKNIEKEALENIKYYFDNRYKGFGKAAKFPQANRLKLLLVIYELTNNKSALDMVLQTLNKMSFSAIYDLIDGGFFRYTIDRKWSKPHFEKMLYTNAELLEVFIKAYKLTKNETFKRVVTQTIGMLNTKFRTKEGFYFSASDADSNNLEGGYFLYSYDEVAKELKKLNFSNKEIQEVLKRFNISEDGIFEEYLNLAVLKKEPNSKDKLVLKALKELRKNKSYPFIDKKIITAWNAMMIEALFKASAIDSRYLTLAKTSIDNLLKKVYKNNTLYHYFLYNKEPKQKALLEDYAFLISALVTAYEESLDKNYLSYAKELTKSAIEQFYQNKKWYLDNSNLKVEASFDSGGYSSALGVMINNLINLGALEFNLEYINLAKETLNSFSYDISTYLDYYPTALIAVLKLQRDVAIIKSNSKNLKRYKKDIFSINYPFILIKSNNLSSFSLCGLSSCFVVVDSFSRLKKELLLRFKRSN